MDYTKYSISAGYGFQYILCHTYDPASYGVFEYSQISSTVCIKARTTHISLPLESLCPMLKTILKPVGQFKTNGGSDFDLNCVKIGMSPSFIAL